MATFTDLPVITSSSITNNHVFAVATTTSTNQISLDELSKSFTGLKARGSSSISIIGSTVPSGITVGGNGYVGIDNTNPTVALDVGDVGSAALAEIRLSSRSNARQASYTLKDSSVYWRNTKKASDTDYYIQCSSDGSAFTGAVNIDINRNVGIFDGSSALSDKFYVSGGTVKFQSGVSGIMFDPGLCEIKTTVAGDILYINKNNSDDICLGDNVLYIENGASSYVGINNVSPQYNLDVNGSSAIARFNNTSSNTTSILFTNTSRTGYLTLINNNLNIGGFAGSSPNNLIYDCSNKRLGLGTASPQTVLHAKSADSITATFESDNISQNEILFLNNRTTGPVISNIVTFASGSVNSPTKRWSCGLYSTGPYVNEFAFLLDGNTSTSAVKASISRDGDLDIKGSLTTDSSYVHGNFIQCYNTRVTGNAIYFNPFAPDSNTNPSGHNDYHAPFGITPFDGSIEKIQILTSDSDCANLTNGLRFEIVSVTPEYKDTNGFVSGFKLSPSSNPVSFPTSGIIGYCSLGTVATNQLKTITKNQFNGTTDFSSGKLLQFRIAEQDGTKVFPVDFTITSVINYTIV